MITLSVLDQTPIFRGKTAAETIHESIALAKATESSGYRRFWVAEHHSESAIACASPEILVAAIAANTTSIRVGSGGVLLPHYSALKVAETFRMLHALFPGRIDLGVGRGQGAGPVGMQTHKEMDSYPQQLKDLLALLTNSFPEDHPYKNIRVMPDSPVGSPEVWFLGTSSNSSQLAAALGMPLCFAQFFRPTATFPELLETYRRSFCPSPLLDKPYASIAVRVICADTEAEALRLASSGWLISLRTQGKEVPIPFVDGVARFPSIEDIDSYSFTDEDIIHMRSQPFYLIAGDPLEVKIRLTELAEIYGVEEIVVANTCPDFQARVRSYQLLAEAFQLNSR